MTKAEFEAVYASYKWLYKQNKLSADEFHTELVELIEEYING